MKYKYPYCGTCDGASRHSDESGPGCSECGDSDWLEMIESDISKGEVRETGGFLWIRISRYAEYPDMRPEGGSVARRMGLAVRVERITHSYDVAEIYYLNANEEQIKAIEEALRKECEDQTSLDESD